MVRGEPVGVETPRNSVQDIWGPRTPYKHQWPTREDQHYLEEPEKWVQAACVMCSNGCGLDYGVKDGKIVGVRGRVSDRVNHGRLGPKGLHAWKSLTHPDRLMYPQIRRHGKLERATWDEAMSLIVERTRDVQRRKTNHGIAFYTTGQFFLEEYYVLAMIGKAGLNTLHMDGNTRLCTATAAASMRESFGSDGQPGSYTDIDYTDAIMMVGHNMSATQTVLWSRVLDRLEGPNPPQLIVVDPRKSRCAEKATLHLAPRIGTNLALLNGIQHLLFKKDYINWDYVHAHVCNVEKLRAVVKEYPPLTVSRITGVPEEQIRQAADIIGKTPTLVSTCLQGVYQSNQATASACAVNNIHMLLGQFGKPGGGLMQFNGQPTAQNNRETGCDGEYPAFRNHQNPAHMQELADIWNIDYDHVPHWNEPTHVENILKYIQADSIEMLWVSGTNPLVSLPNLPKVRELLTKENLFLVVQDIFTTETTAIADVVLPAAAQGEKTGCFTNVDRTVHLSHQAVEPPGECKSDFHIFCDYAHRMDFRDKDGDPLIPFTEPSEAFDAWRRMSKGRPCDYSGMSYEKLTGGSGLQWPCNEDYPFGKERLFDDGVFFTDIEYCETYGHDLETGAPFTRDQYKQMNPAGRAILKECHYVPETEGVDKDYPLQLSTGRRARHFHTRTKTGRTPVLQDADPEPYLHLNSKDAEDRGIIDGDYVLVKSRRGQVELKATIGDMASGQTFVPFHFGYFDNKDGRARAANELTQARWDPVSKQPMFKGGAINVSKIEQQDGEVKIHAKEQQSVAVKKVEEHAKNRPHGGDLHGSVHEETARFLEYWLGTLFGSLHILVEVCRNLTEFAYDDDWEISTGMRVMERIAQTSVDRLGPYASKYQSDREYGMETARTLKRRLFPESEHGELSGNNSYDALLSLQGFWVFLSQLEAHVIALTPSAQALWDHGFVAAVSFVEEQIKRMQAWTRQQLQSRGPQALLVPSKAGVHAGSKIEQKEGVSDDVKEEIDEHNEEGREDVFHENKS